MTIPVSVIIATKNAASTIAATLNSLNDFDEIIVVDSHSNDQTKSTCHAKDVQVIDYNWNGQYPKKRQWILENIATRNEWIFFVDADEITTEELTREIKQEMLQPKCDAYFVKGQPIFCGQRLNYGRWNNKIVLFKRFAITYPEFLDLDIQGMGEIEGHYQPKVQGHIGQLHSPLIHDCAETLDTWIDRHQRYATWQAEVEFRGADLAVSESGWRAFAKRLFQNSFLRPAIMFCDSYLLNFGFLDGAAGLHYAVARGWYYWLISARKTVLRGKEKADAILAET